MRHRPQVTGARSRFEVAAQARLAAGGHGGPPRPTGGRRPREAPVLRQPLPRVAGDRRSPTRSRSRLRHYDTFPRRAENKFLLRTGLPFVGLGASMRRPAPIARDRPPNRSSRATPSPRQEPQAPLRSRSTIAPRLPCRSPYTLRSKMGRRCCGSVPHRPTKTRTCSVYSPASGG
jgi:hypothetical protein